ncbi:F510_1955 family glycosylhydrolase [Guptibacillus hwajinpoensis]|uniref:F510_1955 family glycosylhydrolase n=1 Tax=Guptibacillus hwajinpoensis TaxID=208199 RepID=UPI00384A82DC
MKKISLYTIGLILTVIISACQNDQSPPNESQSIETEQKQANLASISNSAIYKEADRKQIDHVHGIGYPGNRNELLVATHNGPLIYHDQIWYEATTNKNDYMGFQAVSDGFYSSGHPGEGSALPNPLGLIKSTDRGKTLEKLGFQGESDFHYLAVGYETNAIYAVNQQRNSEMEIGVYYSEDAKKWVDVALKGTPDQISGLFTHPSNPNIVAITSPSGLYLSRNQGESFTRITKEVAVSTMIFLEDRFIYAVQEPRNQLIVQTLQDGEEEEVTMPNQTLDTIDYVTVNPQNEDEIVFHTISGSLYQTTDNGKSWTILINEGQIKK